MRCELGLELDNEMGRLLGVLDNETDLFDFNIELEEDDREEEVCSIEGNVEEVDDDDDDNEEKDKEESEESEEEVAESEEEKVEGAEEEVEENEVNSISGNEGSSSIMEEEIGEVCLRRGPGL